MCNNANLMADYRVQGARARLLAGQRQSTCPEGSSARACASDSTAPCMMRMPLERSNGRSSERRTAVSLHGPVAQTFYFLLWVRGSTKHNNCVTTEHRQAKQSSWTHGTSLLQLICTSVDSSMHVSIPKHWTPCTPLDVCYPA